MANLGQTGNSHTAWSFTKKHSHQSMKYSVTVILARFVSNASKRIVFRLLLRIPLRWSLSWKCYSIHIWLKMTRLSTNHDAVSPIDLTYTPERGSPFILWSWPQTDDEHVPTQTRWPTQSPARFHQIPRHLRRYRQNWTRFHLELKKMEMIRE